MKKVTHIELRKLIKEYYKKKLALFCFGTFGIGKSFVVRDVAREIAVERNREFVDWNETSKEQKEEIYKYPEKYFVLIDERLSEYDSSDIKGLPDFREGKETIDWKIPFWAKFMTLKESDGILFFDECNLAPPIVISSMYKVIYDRKVNESKVNDNWFIMGAGNTDEDRAYTHTLPAPVKDRGGEVMLVTPSIESWTSWASLNNIDSRIIGFLNFKPSNLYNVDFENNQKFTTNRGWERVSKLINGVTDWETLDLLCCSAIGEGIAKEFLAFCKIQEKLNLDELIKKPEKIKDIEDISIKYFLVSAVAEKYKNDKVNFDKVMEVCKVLDEINNAEFVALIWRLCLNYTSENKKFRKEFGDSKTYKPFIDKYTKFII